jgi:hypothetical protein
MADMRAMTQIQNKSLDREINILRDLSTRTPSETIFGVRPTIKVGEGGRNDAVTGSSEVMSSEEKTATAEAGIWTRSRSLRGSRKTPFSASPPPSSSSTGRFSSPRFYDLPPDDDLDAILEAQRLEDQSFPVGEQPSPPKRKREVLSDDEYRLRKERTDGLVEGYRRVRERSIISPRELSPGHKPVLDDLEPPPPGLGAGEDDSDSEDDSGIELGRDGADDQSDDGSSPVPQPGASTRAIDPKEDVSEDVGRTKLGDACVAMTISEHGAGLDGSGKAVRVILTVRQLRRVMAARESLFKFGTFVPRSEREADASPEAPRWRAGRDLEWLRLGEQGTFERDWTWARIQAEHSTYKKTNISFLFYVYDYKFSGEHRVRLVFDGSRQSYI